MNECDNHEVELVAKTVCEKRRLWVFLLNNKHLFKINLNKSL
jgi:hypothetical protein